MLSWSRPDPLTRDLVHLINARRHDHGDTEAAIDTLQAFLEQGREYDLLTVLAALDEDMAEWLFDLLAEASCSVLIDGPADEKLSYAVMAALGTSSSSQSDPSTQVEDRSGCDSGSVASTSPALCRNGGARGVSPVDRLDAGAAEPPGFE